MPISPEFIAELKKSVQGEIRTDKAYRVLYSTDASIYQIEPLGVVIPRSQEALIASVELAAKYKIPILPRGAGTSLAGQAIGESLIIDCSRFLNHILSPVNAEDRTVVVEPGVILADVNKAAARHGLMFGPDPASAERAAIGGVIGNNATGAHSIRYGMTADHLQSAEVIFSDGSQSVLTNEDSVVSAMTDRHKEIVSTAFELRSRYKTLIAQKWPETWRNSAGYRLNYLVPWSATRPDQWIGTEYPVIGKPGSINLVSLLAGSEGTLAVIRSAKLGLVLKPKNTVLSLLQYASIAEACDAVPDLLKYNPSAIELIPQMLLKLAAGVPAYAGKLDFIKGDPAAVLVVEFSGDDTKELLKQAKSLSPNPLVAESNAEQAKIWLIRKVGLGIFDSRPSSDRPVAFIEDCAIPAAKLGYFVREVQRIIANYRVDAAFYAHASAGCLHIRPIINLKTGEGVRNLRSIASEVMRLAVNCGGAMSSEHGDGLVRAEWLKDTYGEELLGVMGGLKKCFDPENLLSPGKLFNAPPMDSNLRYGENYRSKQWSPLLSFDRNNGLAGAIEQCNGQGVCRKQDGVMCPSFQATQDEMFSTRGRANLLRKLMSMEPGDLKIEQVKESLDLCLACKGCKAECPSSVDMAKLKYEFQDHYYQNHLRPIRDYLFGFIGFWAILGSPFGQTVNFVMRQPIIRKAMKLLLGISDRRLFPAFNNIQKTYPAAYADNVLRNKNFVEKCIYLPDTFSHYFEPSIEFHALEILERCGIDAQILPVFGAGRTLLSKGFIHPAKKHAEKLLNEINRIDPEGNLPVIGVEPSEIYTFRDELIDLLPERSDEIIKLAARAWLIDEYLIRKSSSTEIIRIDGKVNEHPRDVRILLHGHCYQKSQSLSSDGYPVGLPATAELLRELGYDVDIIDSGCCGMAGAFGYEEKHIGLSLKIGELKLFPYIRKKIIETPSEIVAVGTSCRSQIIDGTGIPTFHSVDIVYKNLN
ncbi:MAG: FAD-linked oxidase C-terminal domain-containing protein [Chloroflexota bacterium]